MNASIEGVVVSSRKTKTGFMQCVLTEEKDGNKSPVMVLTKKERGNGEEVKITGRVGNFMTIDSIQEE